MTSIIMDINVKVRRSEEDEMQIDTSGQDICAHPRSNAEQLEILRQALAKIRFGAIQLTVHEGKLVQMDVTEKRRFQN